MSIASQKIYLDVKMGYYQYVPRHEVPHYLTGFFTRNVCECITGYISSDQGYGFFHFFRLNNANKLVEFINRDFKNATTVKLTLIGANLDTLALPWKTKNRNLTCSEYEMEDSILMDLRKADLLGSDPLHFCCYIKHKDKDDLKKIFEQNKITKCNNLFIYNSSEIDKKLKKRKFQAVGFGDQVEFTICSLKDLVAYQNLANLLSSIIKTSTLFNQYNIIHFNCPVRGNVIADFDGNVGSSFLLPQVIGKLDNHPSEEIKNATEYPTFISLNKQTILDSYKTKI